jgi:hypothetical protein
VRDLYSANVSDLQGSGFALCRVPEIASKFLEYCNRDQQQCELIAVYSARLASMKGTIRIANVLSSIKDGSLSKLEAAPFSLMEYLQSRINFQLGSKNSMTMDC